MSDTDDTDDLLVIPPNFFLVNLDSYSDITICEKPSCVVDDMMNQVEDLRYKLSQLNTQFNNDKQNSNSNYCHSKNAHKVRSSTEDLKFTMPVNDGRVQNSVEDLKFTMPVNDGRVQSTQCGESSLTGKIPLRNHSVYSEIPSMFSDISSISTFPPANEDHLLSEIDNFLTKTVAGFEKQKFTKYSSLYLKNREMEHNNCIDYRQTDYETKQSSISSGKTLNAIQNQSRFDECNFRSIDNLTSLKENQSKDYIEPVEDKQLEVELSLKTNDHYCNFTNIQQSTDSNRAMCSSENSQRQGKQFNKQIYNEEIVSNRNIISKESYFSKDTCDNVHKNDMETLWNCDYKDKQVVQETEILKREQCEREIQFLQTKLLESQEKLAIAVRVDKAKDHAISQLKLAWQRLATNYENKDSQLNFVMTNLQKERMQLQNDKQNYIKSCETHKAEITNSYELVKSLKQKISILEQSQQELNMKYKHQEDAHQCQIKNSELLYNNLMKEKHILVEKNTELTNTIDILKNELEAERDKLIALETQCKSLSVQYENKVSEFEMLEKDKNVLKTKLTEEQEKNNKLEILKRNLNNALDEYKSHEGKVLTEMKNLKKQLEVQKKDLKIFYQNQVESVVKEKMKEFQTQLELAEKCMETEIQKREQILTDKLNNHIQNVIQQSELEINLMKEKHKEEMELCKLQLKKIFQHNSMLKDKLSNYYAKRGKIAEQLHKVMENQWHAAMQIISSPSDKNSDIEYSGILSARYNVNKDDVKVINIPELNKEKLDVDLCDKIKNDISTPIASHIVSNEIDMESYIKQFLLQSSCESKQISHDWLKVSQSTPKLKLFSEDDSDPKFDAKREKNSK